MPLPTVVLVWLSLVVQDYTPANMAPECTTSANTVGVVSTTRTAVALSPERQWNTQAKLSAQQGIALRMEGDENKNVTRT